MLEKFNTKMKVELKICLVTGHEAHWSSFTVLNVLEKAKPEHFQTNQSVLIVCSVHLKLTVYLHGNKQRTLEKYDQVIQKNSSQLNSLCLGLDFIERKMSQHSLGKFCILKEGYVQIVCIKPEIDQIVNVIDQIVNVIDQIVNVIDQVNINLLLLKLL